MSTRLQERRRNPRVTVWTPLTLKADDGLHPATLQNLSMVGVGCTSGLTFEVGHRMGLILELPTTSEKSERHRIEVEAEVVRSIRHRRGSARPRFQLGFMFRELSDNDRATLKEFITVRCDLD